ASSTTTRCPEPGSRWTSGCAPWARRERRRSTTFSRPEPCSPVPSPGGSVRATGWPLRRVSRPRRTFWRTRRDADLGLRAPGARARFARSLREVHHLRDVLPGVERHAAVSRPQVRGPAGRAVSYRRRHVRRFARLLLRL